MLIILTLFQSIFLQPSHSQELLSNTACNERLDPGECTNFAVAWYYDRYAHRCREFFYGGCGGTGNRFSTKDECDQQCHFAGVEESSEARCAQKYDVGTCEADIERWYFDWTLKRCVCSWWSGCGGNSNRFYSSVHCMQVCGAHAQADPLYIQPDWIPVRPMYKNEVWAPTATTQPLHPFAGYPFPQNPQHQPPPHNQKPHPNQDQNAIVHPQHPQDFEIPQNNHLSEAQDNRADQFANNWIVEQPHPPPQFVVSVDYPQSNVKADPYFTGKFDNLPDFEDPSETNEEIQFADHALPELERIPFSRREDALENVFQTVPYAPDYLDARPEAQYPAALRIGNVGVIDGPPQNDTEPEDQPKARKPRDLKTETDSGSVLTTVVSTADKKKRIKVLRKKPLLRGIVRASDLLYPKKEPKIIRAEDPKEPEPEPIQEVLEVKAVIPKDEANAYAETQIFVRMDRRNQTAAPIFYYHYLPAAPPTEVGMPAVPPTPKPTFPTTAKPIQYVPPPVYKVEPVPNKHLQDLEDEGQAFRVEIVQGDYLEGLKNREDFYDEYYTEMEELTEEEVPKIATTKLPFRERLREEMPTEAASWTKDPRLFHAALPFHLVSTKTPLTVPLKLKYTEPPIGQMVQTTPRRELHTNRIPERVLEVPKTPAQFQKLENLPVSTTTTTMATPITTIAAKSGQLKIEMVTSPKPTFFRGMPVRIPFTANAPKPPKNQVDVWSWIRNAPRPTSTLKPAASITHTRISRATPETEKSETSFLSGSLNLLPPTQ
ncbi:unnamed protein product, partial [Mesorhabditis spiculigera]